MIQRLKIIVVVSLNNVAGIKAEFLLSTNSELSLHNLN
jgi:hypothetical protein